MNLYRGRTGKVYVCGQRLGGGGEGDVFALPDTPALAAKIYRDPGRRYMKEKLEVMLAQPVRQNSGTPCIAWPLDILMDGDGNTAGYTMPLITDCFPLYCASREKERAVMFRNYTWKTAVTVACNLALAVRTVHESGIVIGDMNSNNILVSREGYVTLIDTDSFSITDQTTGKVHPCTVGVPNMLPPELQNKDLSRKNVLFTKESDCFGLAVHVVSLLLNNCHPFSCTDPRGRKNTGDITGNIRKGICPYVTGSTFPRNASAPDPVFLPDDIRHLIDRTFTYTFRTSRKKETIDLRPCADEWWRALYSLRTAGLTACPRDPSHIYPKHSPDCPWCRLRGR